MSFSVVVIAKDAQLSRRVENLFPDNGISVSRESSIQHVVEKLDTDACDMLVITSAAFKAGEIQDGELLELIAAKHPDTQTLFLVEPRDARTAMLAMKNANCQYARLPISDDELKELFSKSLPLQKPARKTEARTGMKTDEIIGRSPQMGAVARQIRLAAATDIPVLLTGETGTGKDIAAQAIHRQSDRAGGPFMPIHLGALPTELVASELFGHEKGSFTGADEHEGKFEQAAGGTVFLDEITTIDEKVQVSLLRLIEQKKFSRLGGKQTISTDVRLIAASNQDLQDAVNRGTFREDLYYRLNVFHIVIPPLRERQGDIPLLIEHFLTKFNKSFEKHISGIAPEFFALLESYDWPGNVRELKNVIQRAVLVCNGEVLLPQHLPPRFRPDHAVRPKLTFEIGTPLDEVEREMIIQTLAAVGNNRKRAAEMLGISRRALYNKLSRHNIE